MELKPVRTEAEHTEAHRPVAFDPHAFAEEARKRDPTFREAYEGLADEFAALAEMKARTPSGSA